MNNITYPGNSTAKKDTITPTAIMFLDSDKLGEDYENDMFVGDYNYGNIYHFDLNENENRTQLSLEGVLEDKVANTGEELSNEDIIFAKGFCGITDLEVGRMYVVSIGQGSVYRIIPTTNEQINSGLLHQFLAWNITDKD